MPQQLLTDRYASKIRGVLSCFDRILLTGTLPDICFPEGMTKHLGSKGIRIFDYTKFAEPLRDQIRFNHAEKLASDHGLTIEFLRKPRNVRKEDRIQEILGNTGADVIPDWSISSRPWRPARPSSPGTTRRPARPSSGTRRRQVPALLLLLHRRDARPVLPPRADLGTVPAPVLLQRPQLPGPQARPRYKSIGYQMIDNAFVAINLYWERAQALPRRSFTSHAPAPQARSTGTYVYAPWSPQFPSEQCTGA